MNVKKLALFATIPAAVLVASLATMRAPVHKTGAAVTPITIAASGVAEPASGTLSASIRFSAAATGPSGTVVVNWLTQTYSGFVTAVSTATDGKGVRRTVVTSQGFLTVNATKAQTTVYCATLFVVAPGSKGSATVTVTNWLTGALLQTGTYNLITGGVAVVGGS